ncbi:hypothetical protein THAOC_28749 [Thalassiosira oceanica]|uniref:Uncharacterized protein n=1 Tax=Thalassiosira oceanica TaxID=159749 RepID=K0RE69_THAOC|nr:hypothetical protein THAOC_28749 [Thalassiosira oceanica]|eukprot:EJK52023.1 hypothetical protein THAOC_28749 [Thalassiosira oceanica]
MTTRGKKYGDGETLIRRQRRHLACHLACRRRRILGVFEVEESSHEGEGVEEEGKEEGNEQQEEAQPRDGARVTRSGRVARALQLNVVQWSPLRGEIGGGREANAFGETPKCD